MSAWNQRFSRVAAGFAIVIALVVLIGWSLNLGILKSILPQWVSMKANTAIGFLFSGLCLWFLTDRPRGNGAKFCAAIVMALGFATLLEYLSGWNLGIDEWLFQEPPGAVGTFAPGRMPPITACNFCLLGYIFLSADFHSHRRTSFTQILAIFVGFTGLMSLIGYAYHAENLSGFSAQSQIAFHTAFTFVILTLGWLILGSEHGFMAIISSPNNGGVMARRLLPFIFLVPMTFGWVRLEGQRLGFYGTAFGTGIFVLSMILSLMALLWWNASALNRMDENIRAKERLLQSILNSIGDGVAVADQQGKFILFNPAAERIIGLKAMNAPPSEWSQTFGVFHTDTITPFATDELPLVQAVQGKETNGVEQFLRNENRPEGVYVSVTGRPILDSQGQVQGGVVVFGDVTQQKRFQEELQRANQELTAFSYSVSHDLRAPLRGMMGFSKILLEEHADSLNAEAKDYLSRIINAAHKMGQLVDGLLNLARLSRQEMAKEKVDLSALARSITADLHEQEPSRKLAFVIASDLSAQGDPKLLQSALANLLQNAWKFTAKREDAQIELGATERNGKITYFVRDNGAGFDMRYADKLFGAFQRLHSMKEYEGTGIGLATVQRIIHRHNGEIWAESAPNRGTTFYFTLS